MAPAVAEGPTGPSMLVGEEGRSLKAENNHVPIRRLVVGLGGCKASLGGSYTPYLSFKLFQFHLIAIIKQI